MSCSRFMRILFSCFCGFSIDCRIIYCLFINACLLNTKSAKDDFITDYVICTNFPTNHWISVEDQLNTSVDLENLRAACVKTSKMKLCCTDDNRRSQRFHSKNFALIDLDGYGALSKLTTPFYGSYLRFIQIAVKLGNAGDWWIGRNEFLLRSNDARARSGWEWSVKSSGIKLSEHR